jgi:DNA repair exonuclease SbcCD nuclease subunit
MTRILHTADTHLGCKQYGLEARREDFSRAFWQVVDVAIQEKVDAVVHAGDLFDQRYVSAEDLRDALQGLFTLKAAGIPFLGIVGNHEQRRGVQWLDLFAGLGLAVHLGPEPFQLGDFAVYGLDYAGRRELALPELAESSVLVLHQMLDRAQPLPGAELKLEDLTGRGASLVLLGDYHEHGVWRAGETLITYPGSSERWSLSETHPRGVSLITLELKLLERRELQTRPFIFIREDEDPLKGMDAHSKELKGAVVAVYLKDAGYTIREIEEDGLARGALAVRVRDLRRPDLSEAQITSVSFDVGDLDQRLTERLDKENFSPWTRKIDAIVRDLHIADSRVDDEVTRLLETVWE